MSAQSAQRECRYSKGVEEFGAAFANLSGSLCGLGGENLAIGPRCFYYRKEHHVGTKSTEADIQF